MSTHLSNVPFIQPKAPVMEHAMLRKFFLGLALAVTLALGAIGSAKAASAPLCSTFGEGSAGLESWGPCTNAPNIVVTTSNVGSIGGSSDYHLHLRDTSGASAACSTNANYLGDWVAKMGGCGQFCFDFKVFKSGTPPGPITPSFTIWAGATAHATFVANFTVTASDPWRQHICAPINLAASPPSNAQGHWVVTGGTWNSIITGVTMMQLPIDWTSDPSEEAGYDNLCMSPGGCGNPDPQTTGCLKDSKVAVKCNPDGSYTVTLSSTGTPGSSITMASETTGVTVSPPQQPWSATTTWTITGATAGQSVTLSSTVTKAGGGSKPGTDQCCSGEIKIVMPDCPKPKVGEVVVEKKVKNGTRATNAVINNLVFPIGLTCTAPSNLSVSFGLNNGGTHTENNVPYTSVCTVTESMLTLPPVPKNVCGQGATAVWLTPVITPSTATINAPVTAFTVVNDLECVKADSGDHDVGIVKTGGTTPAQAPYYYFDLKVTNVGTAIGNPGAIVVTDTVPTNMTFSPINGGSNWSCVPAGSATAGTVVTCTYTGPAPGAGQVLPTIHIDATATGTAPYPPYKNCATVGFTTASGLVDTNPANNNSCVTVTKPNSCTPPLVPNVDGICACPPPSTPGAVLNTCVCPNGSQLVNGVCEGPPPPPPLCPPPMVPGPVLGQCICPTGTVLQGKECVKVTTCQPPLVLLPGGACGCPQGTVLQGRECVKVTTCQPPLVLLPGGACGCPQGTVLRGGKCVSPIECRRPLIPNAAGTECVCREGYVKRGNSCVERLVCREPAKLNRAGTACTCPRNMVLKGNTCVERGPRITPNDVIRNIPGGFGPGRGGRDNPREPGGGDKSGPTRGGGSPAFGR